MPDVAATRKYKLGPELVAAITEHPFGHRPRVFLETGTFQGLTTEQMAQVVDVVESVELSPALATAAGRRLDGVATVHVGDSRDVLPGLLAKYTEPCIVYLDAHSEPPAFHPDCATSVLPLWDELAAVAAHGQDDILVVDDVKTMGTFREGWESVSVDAILDRLPHVAHWVVLEDHLVAYLGRKPWREVFESWSASAEYLGPYNAENRRAVHERVMATIPQGRSIRYCEFGVANGSSLDIWVEGHTNPQSMLFAFDSFHGLPEPWEASDGMMHPKGQFTRHGRVPKCPDQRVEFYAGWFEDTVPPFFSRWNYGGQLVVHVDCDLLESTRTVFREVAPHLKAGDWIIMDEAGSPGAEEFHAFMEAGIRARPMFRAGCCLAVQVV